MRTHLCKLTTALATALPLGAQTFWPTPPTPAGNPTTPAKTLLGKALFWDEQLSASGTVACGTCHVSGAGGSDPRAFVPRHPGPDGVFGTADDIGGALGVVQQDAAGRYVTAPLFGIRPQATTRRPPSAINAAYQPLLFWDGRALGTFTDPVSGTVLLPADAALESQAAAPPVSTVEMSHLGRSWNDIAADLQHRAPLLLAENLPPALQSFVAGQTYAALFAQVFGSPGVTPARIVFAIAAYERTLIADQSPLDQYLAGTGNLSSQELQGFQVFALLCIACHTDVNVTVLGTGPVLNDFRNIGLRPVADDPGRFAITNLPADRGRFKVPSLRNVALRAPYFHNGRLLTLGEVIDFYSRGGDFADNRDPLLARIPGRITAGDRAALIAFLQAMTDPRVAAETAPFDRPRLFSASQRVPNVFGTGTIGSGGQSPAVVALSPPYLGNARWSLGVDRVQAVAFQWLLWDVSANFSPTVVLGQNVFLGMTPSLALTGLPALTQGSGANGHGTVAFAIPANTSLRGASLFCQWLLTDPQGPNGFVTSDAFGFTVF